MIFQGGCQAEFCLLLAAILIFKMASGLYISSTLIRAPSILYRMIELAIDPLS